MIIGAIALAGLVKVLIETENPRLCAGLFAAMLVVFESVAWLAGIGSLTAVLLVGVLGYLGSYAYFWVLNRIEPLAWSWWTVLILGVLLMLFL